MINDKIGAGGFAAMLALSRIFTEATALPGETVQYGMQRFTVILLSFLLTAALYVPLAAVCGRDAERSPLETIAGGSRLLAGFTGTILSLCLLTSAAETGLRSHYYASSTVFDSAPSLYFYILTGAAVLFAVRRGMEASSRTAVITAAILAALLILIAAALSQDIHTDRLYPALADNTETLWSETVREFSLNCEYLIFAVLCGKVSGKRLYTLPAYLGASCTVLLMMTFMYNTVFGRLTSRLEFPFYTLSSISDITLLHRINGIDVTVWVMAGMLKLASLAFAFGRVVTACFTGGKDNGKAAGIAALIFPAAALGLSELFTAYPELYEPVKRVRISGVSLLFVGLFIPAAAFILGMKSRKRGCAA
ncbi:MAG: GerAB/ArcD/ProY family transporter [Ruminiclostridium sp.]|nr:GerAB/ArcD/ProY family transporter [Ruminiclostridium sp.]